MSLSISVYTASGRYIGEISKAAPISHLKHTGHLAIHRPYGKFPFLPSRHLNLPLQSHIYT